MQINYHHKQALSPYNWHHWIQRHPYILQSSTMEWHNLNKITIYQFLTYWTLFWPLIPTHTLVCILFLRWWLFCFGMMSSRIRRICCIRVHPSSFNFVHCFMDLLISLIWFLNGVIFVVLFILLNPYGAIMNRFQWLCRLFYWFTSIFNFKLFWS